MAGRAAPALPPPAGPAALTCTCPPPPCCPCAGHPPAQPARQLWSQEAPGCTRGKHTKEGRGCPAPLFWPGTLAAPAPAGLLPCLCARALQRPAGRPSGRPSPPARPDPRPNPAAQMGTAIVATLLHRQHKRIEAVERVSLVPRGRCAHCACCRWGASLPLGARRVLHAAVELRRQGAASPWPACGRARVPAFHTPSRLPLPLPPASPSRSDWSRTIYARGRDEDYVIFTRGARLVASRLGLFASFGWCLPRTAWPCQ